MSRFSVAVVGGTALAILALGVMAIDSVLAPARAANCDKRPDHPDCQPEPPPPGDDPDRIAGCVTLADGYAIQRDRDEPYCDGEPTKAADNSDTLMQVAMNCQFNHFNLYVGGGLAAGGRHVDLVLGSPILTMIESCKSAGATADIYYQDVNSVAMIDCDDADPDWGFNQLLRTEPGRINVCDLGHDQTIDVPLRFQNNLHHDKTCKGGARKCGKSFEELIVNYGSVAVTCVALDADIGRCMTWTVVGGGGELTHDEGGGDGPIDGSFHATFSEGTSAD